MKFKNKILKSKLRSGEMTIGSWITLGHPAIAEIMADAGFEWLVIDMEHSSITIRDVEDLVRVISLKGIPALVRVGENNPNLIKRVMDTGADGVIVAMVNSKEEAERAVSAVKYPPIGTRGVGLARAQKYGFGFEGYKKWVEEESIIIVQVEHRDGIENIEDIFRVDGVDGFIIGPYDLSGSYGQPGNFKHPKMINALNEVMKISKKMKKSAGFHVVKPDVDDFEKKVNEGYSFIAFGFDALFLGLSCRESLKKVLNKNI